MKASVTFFVAAIIGYSRLFSQTADQHTTSGFYVLQDYQYFKPMLADIRRPAFHMRFYWDDAVKFSNSPSVGKHRFWDVGFGGYFPMIGYNYKNDRAAPKTEIVGLVLFTEASTHMLLDFDTPSSDVINTDYRLGAGFASRPTSKLKNLSWRYKFFHESTHLGDEFTLAAVADSAFRRYNLSYEAHEVFLAFDHYAHQAKSYGDFASLRFYIGGRLMNASAFEDFRNHSPERSLKAKDKTELQIGGESYWQGSRLPPSESGRIRDFLRKIVRPQCFSVAADFYRRDKYAVDAPSKIWSFNIVFSLVYGDYLEGNRTTKLMLNYYRGVNPHGQLRMYEIGYLGIAYSVDF